MVTQPPTDPDLRPDPRTYPPSEPEPKDPQFPEFPDEPGLPEIGDPTTPQRPDIPGEDDPYGFPEPSTIPDIGDPIDRDDTADYPMPFPADGTNPYAG
jgi:hypothetical protein